jgi:glycosyltransferase involved in cell wall biosynthesis
MCDDGLLEKLSPQFLPMPKFRFVSLDMRLASGVNISRNMPVEILVLSSTRKQHDGIAEYTRQVFRPEFQAYSGVKVTIVDIAPGNMLAAPFKKADVLHIQHEFFMFDRLVGISALFYYPYLWFWSKCLGFKIVTTIHSTYNVNDLPSALPHFQKLKWLFPLGSLYIRLHFLMLAALSTRILILSKVGMENMRRVFSEKQMRRKIQYVHLGNYSSNIQMQPHGLLKQKYGLDPSHKIFTLFGFAFPIKGYEYGIQAMDILVNQRGRRDLRLIIVSGETGKASFPGGGQGKSYIDYLKGVTRQLRLDEHVIFTGYLADKDPLLEEIFAGTFCFLFPYLNRNFPSGAISTVLASRKPILVSRIPCFDEYEGLLTFEEKDPLSLADKMTGLLTDPAHLAEAGRITQHNADAFAMEHIFECHEKLYREITGCAKA